MESSGEAKDAAGVGDGHGEGRALKPYGIARSAAHHAGLGSRRTERAPLSTTDRTTG